MDGEGDPTESGRGAAGASAAGAGGLARLRRVVLTDADRLWLAGVFAVGLFVALLAAGVALGDGASAALRSGDPVETLFQGFLTAIVTGVTLVVSINQVVLSQELGALGDQRDRMEEALATTADVEAAIDGPAPTGPGELLRALALAVAAAARDLEAGDDESLRAFGAELRREAEATAAALNGARFGGYAVVRAALGFEYAALLARARRHRARLDGAGRAGDGPGGGRDRVGGVGAESDRSREGADGAGAGGAGTDDPAATLDAVVDRLALYGVAREHVKTLFFQWELVGLSRRMLSVGVPALGVAAGVVLFFDPSAVGGAVLGVDPAVTVVVAGVTACSSPFLLLASYVLRLATVARRTLAIGPLVLRDRSGDRLPDRDADREGAESDGRG